MCHHEPSRTHKGVVPELPGFRMQNVGIPAADIQKLQTAGIYTVDGLARAPRRELEAVKGLSSAKVDKLLKEGAPAPGCMV